MCLYPVERAWFLEAKGLMLPNHDTGRILPSESQVHITDSSVTNYDSVEESTSVSSTPLPLLEKLVVHTTTYHNDIEWFRRGEALQAKNAESSNASRSKTPTKSGCSWHMTGVKSYLHKYEEQPGLKVAFRDDSTCTTLGYGSSRCNGIFDEKKGIICNTIKEVVMIAPRDNPCSSCEKGKHHRARFKTKQTSSIKKCLYLLHMDLFRPVTPRSINHEKYTLVIVDDYSRNNILVNFYDEKGNSQNFSFPYIPEQNGLGERKNKTLIEAIRTMLSGSVFSKQYWTEAVTTACYTQSTIPDQNDHLVQKDEISNDDQAKHSNHTNDDYIMENITNTKDGNFTKPPSSSTKDASAPNAVLTIQI
ncbi:retrovirus-related pol polyprotein from transposon TNT 1-94 [Tanacetum coccineum]